MNIKFLGTGAAEGFPSVFCKCEYCVRARELGVGEYRSRTQVIIDGKMGIDFPPDAYTNSLKHKVNLADLEYLLITHSHMDHFYAHDFILRGYKYAKFNGLPLKIYGNSEVKAVFDEWTAREMKPEVLKNFEFNVIKSYETFVIDGYRIITIPANHSKTEDALLFYIEKEGKGYLHLHDSGLISDEALQFLANQCAKAAAVAFDCTFIEHSAGATARHMGLGDNLVLKKKLLDLGVVNNKTKIIITHFSHNSNPLREHLNGIEHEYSVTAAYDGMVVNL